MSTLAGRRAGLGTGVQALDASAMVPVLTELAIQPRWQWDLFIPGMDVTMILYIQTSLLLKDLIFLIFFFLKKMFDNYLLSRILLLGPLNKKEPNVLRSQLRITRRERVQKILFNPGNRPALHKLGKGWVNVTGMLSQNR